MDCRIICKFSCLLLFDLFYCSFILQSHFLYLCLQVSFCSVLSVSACIFIFSISSFASCTYIRNCSDSSLASSVCMWSCLVSSLALFNCILSCPVSSVCISVSSLVFIFVVINSSLCNNFQ